MRGAPLFDADTLRELWPVQRELSAPWFEGGKPMQWLPVYSAPSAGWSH